MSSQFCTNCGKPLTEDRPACPHCGANQFPALPVGTLLRNGNHVYKVGTVLGQGGFGITYKGIDEATGQELAIKEYFPARIQRSWVDRDQDGVTVFAAPGMEESYNKGRMSFVKEAQAVSQLDDSPASIVKGVDYLELNGTAYLILEFLPGQPLFKAVRAHPNGRMTPEELFPKFMTLIDGIIWLHGKGMIHRDICPDNIMLLPNGELCLTDFGAARPEGGQMTGFFKPGYAPVEQSFTPGSDLAKSMPLGFYSDVYTVAATIVYCLSGKTPAVSTERLSLLTTENYDPLVLPDCLTEKQQAVFYKALAIRPGERYQTMEEFKQALRSTIPEPKPDPVPVPKPKPQPDPIPPRPDPTSGLQRLLDWANGHKPLAALVCLAVLLALFVAIIFIVLMGTLMTRYMFAAPARLLLRHAAPLLRL